MVIPDTFQNILVTGGAGFIGSHIVDDLLEMKRSVTILDNLTSGKLDFLKQNIENPNLKLIKGDLLINEDLVKAFEEPIDTIIHLAANPDISLGIEDPTLDFNQTINATFNLLLKMREKGVKKLIYFSGSGVYGDVGEKYTAEDFGPLLPVSMYGASKLSAEALISAFSHLFGIKVWIFRPANIVGNRATHGVVFDFINKLKENPDTLTILGDGNQSKSYIYITDVLNAVWFTISKVNNPINIFNLSSDSFVTVNEIAKIVIEVVRLENVQIHHTEGRIGWPGDVPIVRISSKKINDLGWKPEFNSAEAIRKTAQSLVENNSL